jgi:flagellar export protein FliJ
MNLNASSRFRFATLLKLRQQQEDRCKRAVAERLRLIHALSGRHDRLGTQLDEQSRWLRASLGDATLDVDGLRWGRHWLARLRQGMLQTDAEIAAHRAMLAQERVALSDAHRGARVLATLKDRQLQARLAQERRREQAELDEINVLRYAHAALDNSEANS